MNQARRARLQQLLLEARSQGFVYYPQLAEFFPSAPVTGPELDEVLAELEQSNVEIRRDPALLSENVPEKDTASEQADHPLQVYLREVAAVPPLMPGRPWNRKEVAEANLALVAGIAQHYRGPDRHIWNLIQKGNQALIEAADTFHRERGYKFATYTTFCVHRALHDLMAKPVRKIVPAHLQ